MPDKPNSNSKDLPLSPLEESLKMSFYYPMQEDVMDDDPYYGFDPESLSCGSDPAPEPPKRKKKAHLTAAQKKWRIFLLLMTVCTVAYFVISSAVAKNRLAHIEENCIAEATKIVQGYGLELESIDVHAGTGELKELYAVHYYLSGMDKLPYRKMYGLADRLDSLKLSDGKTQHSVHCGYIYSEGNKYDIRTYTRSVYMNGKCVDDDYENSECHKSYLEDHPWKKKSTKKTQTTTSAYTPSPRKPYIPDEDEDEFNAKDFSNPEDFYDEYYYDFFDYYDAEDYWYEHCE